MTEEDDQTPGEDVESTDGENETLQEATLEEMQEFLEALNLFVLRVASMDWPEAFNLTENENSASVCSVRTGATTDADTEKTRNTTIASTCVFTGLMRTKFADSCVESLEACSKRRTPL